MIKEVKAKDLLQNDLPTLLTKESKESKDIPKFRLYRYNIILGLKSKSKFDKVCRLESYDDKLFDVINTRHISDLSYIIVGDIDGKGSRILNTLIFGLHNPDLKTIYTKWFEQIMKFYVTIAKVNTKLSLKKLLEKDHKLIQELRKKGIYGLFNRLRFGILDFHELNKKYKPEDIDMLLQLLQKGGDNDVNTSTSTSTKRSSSSTVCAKPPFKRYIPKIL